MATGDPFHGLEGPTLQFVLESPIQAAVLVQSSGLVEAASPAAIADLGLAPDQIVSRRCEQVLGLDLPRVVAAAETRGALHRTGSLRFRVHRVGGRNETVAYLVEILAVPAEHEGGILASRAERLESIVVDLSDRFEELNRFVGVISHDLQAPLRRLLSFVELLRGDLDDPPPAAMSSIEQIERGADHMLRLTTELLRYARLGRSAMPLTLVDGDDALSSTLTLLEDKLHETGATVSVHGTIGPVAATRTFLMLVFQNLVENAIKYHDPDRPLEITVDSRHEDATVVIDVSDTGSGIAAPQVDSVFDPFRQIRTGDDLHGAFGLATVKRIVERFGGDISVSRTEVGVGTTFTLRLDPTGSGTAVEPEK